VAQIVVVEGLLVGLPKVGKRVAVIRVTRNGLRHTGVFWTQRVTAVVRRCFHTVGSVYEIEYVTPHEWN
jgi:uncharacterized protein YjeT (DUF2065 family)